MTRTTDTFTGTVAVGGSDFHSFPIATTGIVDVTLTAATPPATIVMGAQRRHAGGRQVHGDGGRVDDRPRPAASVQLSGMASPGTLCVDVHDVGNQSAPVSYTVTVTHP